jgi:hypothetical protein
MPVGYGGWYIPNYKKYTWVGNRISDEDMAKLYQLKEKTKKPITLMVAEAVSLYLKKKCGEKNEKKY